MRFRFPHFFREGNKCADRLISLGISLQQFTGGSIFFLLLDMTFLEIVSFSCGFWFGHSLFCSVLLFLYIDFDVLQIIDRLMC